MKVIKILLTTILVIFLFNNLAFPQQDTTFYIDSNGNVGIGTSNPNIQGHPNTRKVLTMLGDSDGAVIEIGSDIPTNGIIGVGRLNFYNGTTAVTSLQIDSNPGSNNTGDFQIFTNDGSGITPRIHVTSAGNVGFGTTTPNHPLEMSSGAHVTTGGVWTNASSREFKENIHGLTDQEAIETLSGLFPVKFNYKLDENEKYLGFIAEEVPDLVATNDRKSLSPMDIVALLTKVVQMQQKRIEALEKQLNSEQ